MKPVPARDLQPGTTFVEHGHHYRVQAVEQTSPTTIRISTTLPGGAPQNFYLAPDAEVDVHPR